MEQQNSFSGARTDRERTVQYAVGSPPQAARARTPAFAIAAAGIGVISFGFVIAGIVLRGGISVAPGWDAAFIDGAYRVTDAGPQAAGLAPGDRIVEVAGDRWAWFYGPQLALSRIRGSGSYEVTVLRAGGVVQVPLRLRRVEGSWEAVVPNLLVCALLYALGFWIGSVKFRDVTGRLATLAFLLTVFTFLSVVARAFPGWSNFTSALALVVANLARPVNLAVGYHFFSRFPQPLPESAVRVALRRVLYGLAVLLWVPLNAPAMAHVMGVAPGRALALVATLQTDARPGGLLIPAYETLAAVLMGVALARNYYRSGDPDSRRRLRWAGLGFAATLGVFLVFALLKLLWYLTGSSTIDSLEGFANNVATLVIGLSCVALAYGVARHRVLGIHVVARRGAHYLLAKRALQVFIVLPALLLVFEMMRSPDRRVRDVFLHEPWPFYVLVTVTGAISLRYRGQMRSWLDRRFFLPQLEAEGFLVALAERIRTAESDAEVCLSAAREIDAALQVTAFHVLVRSPNDGKLRVAHSQAIDTAVRLRDWLNGWGADLLRAGAIFSVYECEDTGRGEVTEWRLPAEQLVVPLIGTNRAEMGALVLGPKRSEQPYTGRDRNLLQTVACQIALVYEVLRLKESVEREKRAGVQALGRLDEGFAQLLNECPDCGRCCTAAETACPHDGAALTVTLPVEKTIGGKYRLDRRIGRGGMGVVYEAADLSLGRSVAIKIMVGDLFGNAQALTRFEREARVEAALSHPNIVRIYDFGRLPSGGAYLVMELVPGVSWRERLRDRGGIPPAQLAHWMKQLCSAMEAAHAKGIIHRDLKPENIMITSADPMGRVIVLDFGLAKLREGNSSRDLTVTGPVMGTLGYMSPEQRAGRRVDAATDVFALAVICAETLTGRRPPRGGPSMRWLEEGLARAGPRWTALGGALERGLAEHPSRRPTVGELWRSLASALAEQDVQPSTAGSTDDVKTVTMTGGAEADR